MRSASPLGRSFTATPNEPRISSHDGPRGFPFPEKQPSNGPTGFEGGRARQIWIPMLISVGDVERTSALEDAGRGPYHATGIRESN